jgi:hypothetical protein
VALQDGKDQHRDEIGKAVKSALGKDYNDGTFGQAMAKLSKEKLIRPVKGKEKRGHWMLNK